MSAAEVAPAPVVETPVVVEDAPVAPVDETPAEVPAEVSAPAQDTPSTPEKPAVKRSPFSDLKNKLFAPKSTPAKAAVVDEPAKEEVKAEETPAVAEVPAVVEEAPAAVTEAPAAETTEVTEPAAPAVVEEPAVKKEKVHKAGVFDKVKALFEHKPKAPKVKTPTEETAPVVEEPATEAPAAEAPAVEETPAVVAETPAVVETPAPVVEETPAVVTETTAEEPAVKFDVTKTEKTEKKKGTDLAKLGRRLSAKISGLASPKKEKKDPIAESAAVSEVAPKVSTEVDTSPIVEEVAPAAVEEPTPVVEEPKVEEPKVEEPAKVDEPVKVEEPTVAAEETTPVVAEVESTTPAPVTA